MEATSISYSASVLSSSIFILDGDGFVTSPFKKKLANYGYENVKLFHESPLAIRHLGDNSPRVFLVSADLYLGFDGFSFVRELRDSGYLGLVMLIDDDFTMEKLFKASLARANDYYVSGANLNLEREIKNALTIATTSFENQQSLREISATGFLRSVGLTAHEIALLQEYARGLPRHRSLSKRIDRSELQIRKAFSLIYEKLEISSLPQLAQLITVLCTSSRV